MTENKNVTLSNRIVKAAVIVFDKTNYAIDRGTKRTTNDERQRRAIVDDDADAHHVCGWLCAFSVEYDE